MGFYVKNTSKEISSNDRDPSYTNPRGNNHDDKLDWPYEIIT